MTAEQLRRRLLWSMRKNGDPIKSDLAPSEPIAVPVDNQSKELQPWTTRH